MGDIKNKIQGRNNIVNNASDHATINATQNIGFTQEELKEFPQEISEAIKRINALEGLEQSQKDGLIKLMNKSKTAVEQNNETAIESCKEGFEMIKIGLGKISDQVMPVFKGLRAVVKFFGIDVALGVPL